MGEINSTITTQIEVVRKIQTGTEQVGCQKGKGGSASTGELSPPGPSSYMYLASKRLARHAGPASMSSLLTNRVRRRQSLPSAVGMGDVKIELR